jgi:hypothetical protein
MANQNENLVYGWQVQQLGNTASQTGYAQPGQAPNGTTVSAAEQASSGASAAPAPTVVAEVLTNPGYAGGNGTMLGVVTAPAVPASTVAIQNPFGLAAQVTVIGGTVTAVNVAPNVAGAAGTYVQVGSGDGQVTVPPAGWIKVTYSVAPTWSWTTIN